VSVVPGATVLNTVPNLRTLSCSSARRRLAARFAAMRVDAARADLELELGHAQNQPSTLLRAGTPPAWTTVPSMTTAGVDITP